MSGRHTGGVQGTVLMRGYCPVCGRGLAGGNVERDRSRISLRPHRRLDGTRPWCTGGRSVVPRDDALTAAWAQQLRRNRRR